MRPLQKLIEITLQHPKLFEWQQRLCNNYENIQREFHQYYSKADQTILDVGCSTGTCAGQIVDMEHNRYFGIDISDEYTKRAQRLYPKGTFLTMDASKLTFQPKTFDIVTFTGVLHHMESSLIERCLKSIRNAMKPGGVILVAEPVFTPGKYFSNFLLSLDRGRFIRDREGYKALFKDFQLEREGFFPFSAHRFCSLVFKS